MPVNIPIEQIVDRILIDNEWWQTGEINSYYRKMTPRAYMDLFQPLVFEKNIRRAVVLMGPRRVGKTVMLYHTIQKLIESGINARNICYISVETPIYNKIWLEELMQLVKKQQGREDFRGMYFFFDEIQYLKDWEIHLKSLVDTFLDTKFIVSGSAAAALKLKSQESGAGRFTDFILPPLTFYEFLLLKQMDGLVKSKSDEGNYTATDINELNSQFVEYINHGGYPEVTLNKDIQADQGRFIRNDIVDKVLLRDLPSLYGIEDVQELNSLFTSIAYNTGDEISMESLSQRSQVSKHTIKRYLEYLEAAFLIRIVHRIDDKASKFKRAYYFKVYLTNPSLRSALFSNVKPGDVAMGNMVETAIFSQWEHSEIKEELYYARWDKGELDMVFLGPMDKPLWAVEVKTSNDIFQNHQALKKYIAFCKNNDVEELTVTTLDILKTKEIEGFAVDFEPSSLYCYAVGRNLIEGKRRRF